MRIRFVGAALLALGLAAPALAQDFGVMESAETLNRGNIKLMAYPLLIFGSQDEDNQLGVVGRAGYGFTDNLDAEAKVAIFDKQTIFGADLELWLLKGGNLDVSAIVGGHIRSGSDTVLDTKGLDLTGLASTHLNDSLELYGAFDVAFEKNQRRPVGLRRHLHDGPRGSGDRVQAERDSGLRRRVRLRRERQFEQLSCGRPGVLFPLRPDLVPRTPPLQRGVNGDWVCHVRGRRLN